VKKNRYRNVVPYDHTRIRLRFSIHSLTDPSTSNDYINANWIEVTSLPDASNLSKWSEYGDFNRRFISTQGPLAETLSDFWRMVWQEDCQVVVALTREVERGRVKCARYWPEHVGEEVEFETAGEKFLVKLVAAEELGDYTTRLLELTKLRTDGGEGEPHVIYHYQFLGWLDNSCPSNSVLLFLDEVNRKLEETGIGRPQQLPVVVHCSAGIGRTGTFIVLDILLNRIKAVGPHCIIDIPKTVRMLREQRATMVQTEAQYRFIYQAISAYMRLRREHAQGGLTEDEGTDSCCSSSPHLPPSLENLHISQNSLPR